MVARFLPLEREDPPEIGGYPLRARLGAGGMGNVYLSFSTGGMPVAIKVVKREFAADPEFRRRFKREVVAAQQVRGAYTAMVLGADPDAPVPWLAVTYIGGPSLLQAVAEHGPFPLLSVFRLLAGTAEGIADVHRAELIHRDLKPANVLLAVDGPKVIDFGIVHAVDASTLTSTGQVIGTPAYMAPEQISGEQVTQAADVWALGNLAVYAATGHAAFGDGLQSVLIHRILNNPPLLDGCPDALRPVAERCLDKDAAARPTVDEVMAFAMRGLQGQTMRLAGASWLPPRVAETLPAYDTRVAPLPPWPAPVSQQPTQPAFLASSLPPGPPGNPGPRPAAAPAAAPAARRSRRRWIIVPSVVAVAAVAGVAAVLLGRAGSAAPASRAASTPPATHRASNQPAAGSTGTAPATQGPTTPAPATSSASPGPTDTSAAGSQPAEYANRPFTLAGGGCASQFDGTPSYVTFLGSGPSVTPNQGSGGDLELTCNANNTQAPGISFANGDRATEVTGSQDAASCDAAVTTHPQIGDFTFARLAIGEQFCVVTAQNQLALITLLSKNASSYDLGWSVTGWAAPQS